MKRSEAMWRIKRSETMQRIKRSEPVVRVAESKARTCDISAKSTIGWNRKAFF